MKNNVNFWNYWLNRIFLKKKYIFVKYEIKMKKKKYEKLNNIDYLYINIKKKGMIEIDIFKIWKII